MAKDLNLKTLLSAVVLVSLIGCSNSFNAEGPSSSIPTLEGCGGCDIAGEGGSLKLMQTSSAISVDGISLQSLSSATYIPVGSWAGTCIYSTNGGGAQQHFLTVSNNSALRAIKIFTTSSGCDDTDLDEIRIMRYTFTNYGTASPGLNYLYTTLMQITSQPHSTGATNWIKSSCSQLGINQGILTDDGSVSYDISGCFDHLNNPYMKIGSQDTSSKFWTDGKALRLIETHGTFNFTK